MSYELSLVVNGQRHKLAVKAGESLAELLRDRMGLTGTKRGCDSGGCGSCTVILDEKSAIYSCMMPALKVNGRKITTIEGLTSADKMLDPVQKAFVENWAFQCGYCTPGFIIAIKALLASNPAPNDFEMREALAGNLCRCTGYTKILEAVKQVIRSQ